MYIFVNSNSLKLWHKREKLLYINFSKGTNLKARIIILIKIILNFPQILFYIFIILP